MRLQPTIPIPPADSANTSIPWHEAREEGDLNLVCQTGYLGTTPELEQTMRGFDFVVLRVCCCRVVTFHGHWEPIRQNNWTSWVAFGAMARMICQKYIKGCHVFLRGKVETHEFTRVRRTSAGRGAKLLRRETHIITEIKLLRWPKSKPEKSADAPADEPVVSFGLHRGSKHRNFSPEPIDYLQGFDPNQPMPDDAKGDGNAPPEEPQPT